MNKICTSLEQSQKLLELGIDINTADMFYTIIDQGLYLEVKQGIEPSKDDIPCWSLVALLSLIKDKCGYFELVYLKQTIDGRTNLLESNRYLLEDVHRLSTDVYDVYQKEAVDACYEMIVKLYELKML